MRKIFFAIVVILLSGAFASSASAETAKVKKIGDTEIEILEDGRVAPVSDYQNLSEEELNSILLEIGYSFKDIANYKNQYKKQLVSFGGKVVEPDDINIDYSYISDEQEYKLTDYSRSEIRAKQIDDLENRNITAPSVIEELTLPESGDISTFDTEDCQTSNGSCAYGKFEGRLQAVKVGETATQSKYIIQQNWDWVTEPFVQGTDYAGVHWGSKGEPEAGTAYGEGAYSWDDEFYNYFGIPIDTSSNYGISADIEFPVDDLGRYEHYQGSIMEEVNINTNTHPEGSRVSVSGVYAHPHTPNNWSIGLSVGGISINGNLGTGDKFTWRYTFTVE